MFAVSTRFSYQAGSWNKKRRVVAKVEWQASWFLASVSSSNLSRPTKRVVAFYVARRSSRKARTGPVCHVASSATMPFGSSFTPWPSGQLHEDTGFAEGGGALVDDDVARQAGEDRGQADMAATLRSNWLRWRCRGTCSGKSSLIDDLRRRPARPRESSDGEKNDRVPSKRGPAIGWRIGDTFPWRWESGAISTNLDGICGLCLFPALAGHALGDDQLPEVGSPRLGGAGAGQIDAQLIARHHVTWKGRAAPMCRRGASQVAW